MTQPPGSRSEALFPKPPGRISGTCLTPEGEPLRQARINVFSSDDVLMDTQLTDAAGRYTTRLLFAGRYRVELRIPDLAYRQSQECEVHLGEVTRVDFTLSP